MEVGAILESFKNWGLILNIVIPSVVMTSLVSIITISLVVAFVLYLFGRA